MTTALSQEEELLMQKMLRLKYRESQTQLVAIILALVCYLSIAAISIGSAYSESDPFRLLTISVYPLSIIAMSINRSSQGFFSIAPLVVLAWISVYALRVALPVYLCILGTIAAYHMLFNSLPLVRFQLRSIEKSPLYPGICTKLLKRKMNKRVNS